MFTPPPSPLPTPNDPLAAAGAVLAESEKCTPKSEAARPVARSQRLLGLIVPVVILVVISLSSRRAAGDSLAHVNSSAARSPAVWVHDLAPRHHLPRQLVVADPADAVPTATATPTPTTSSPGNPSPQQLGAGSGSVAPAIPAVPWAVPTPFPQVFDSSLSFSFSTPGCSSFFSAFTTNMTFRACRPFSLLLGTSTAFFNAQSNLTEFTAVMGGTCNTPQTSDQCRSTMDWLASEIVKPAACATEISERNRAVLDAQNGFKTYDLMRQAGCLVNQRSNAYCFVEAVASTSPSDTYFYSLPLGTPVPQTSTPSCSACIKSLMSLYADHAKDGTIALSKVYSSAQKLASSTCGADYANSVVNPNAASPSVTGAFTSASLLLGTMFGLVFSIWSLTS